jgi:hypothetical protein
MLRTPRDKFSSSVSASIFKNMVQTESFEEATLAALDQMLYEMPLDCTMPQQAADAHQQMAGARKYLDLLCNIHQAQPETKPAAERGLNYQAGV